MQTHERIRLEPVTARRMSPVDHDDLGARRGDQRVGECHPGCAASDDEVVGYDGSLWRDFTTRARGDQAKRAGTSRESRVYFHLTVLPLGASTVAEGHDLLAAP